jgi:hypothetical protein
MAHAATRARASAGAGSRHIVGVPIRQRTRRLPPPRESDRAARDPAAHGATAPNPPAAQGAPVRGVQAKPADAGAGA